jgi:hypothetical protein
MSLRDICGIIILKMFEAFDKEGWIDVIEAVSECSWEKRRNYDIIVVFEALGMIKKVRKRCHQPCSFTEFSRNLDDV